MHGAGAIELVERDLQNTSDHAPEMMRIQLHEMAPINTRGTKKFVLLPMALYNANRMEGPNGLVCTTDALIERQVSHRMFHLHLE